MKSHSLPTLLLLALASLGCNPPQPPPPKTTDAIPATFTPHATSAAQSDSATKSFDYYLLNLSWSPEFCATHATAPECASHSAFVLHGLWPQSNAPADARNTSKNNAKGAAPRRSRGTSRPYLENCSNAPGPANSSRYADIYPDPGLLQHEWRTHGTCSGLTPDAYFTAARTAFHSVTIPPKLTQLTAQITLPPDDILSLFTSANPSIPATSLALSCGNNYLTAIQVCLDKSLHPTPCGPIRSCRANTVRISPP